ncbi:Hypothetical predicted protein [Mytilus galloprovincialis]|uniref:LRAT domain-containing protein n=1 Tax=Mytilus galloprovincialis TaxID=29158 RepID=A0A8B6DDG3_MYTGA|nr:Hypothetical predicted protein [Mytilus galloprovincialis]
MNSITNKTVPKSSFQRIRFKTTIKEIRVTNKDALDLVQSSSVSDINKLYKGAHVKFKRWIPYTHHAIVTNIDKGDSKFTVVHFNNEQVHDSKYKSKITEEIMTFSKTDDVLLVHYNIDQLSIPHFKRLPNQASVAVAKYFSDKQNAWPYNILTHNCEHFVFSCTTGYAISFQNMILFVMVLSAFKQVSEEAVKKLVEFKISQKNKYVEYNAGDCHVTITLKTGETVTVPLKSQQNNI